MFSELFSQHDFLNGDIRIHYRIGGEGPPLLLLHGYPQNHYMWHAVADRLAQRFTVICPDLRGYGKSSKPRGLPDHSNYSKKEMALDMVELMSSLGFETFMAAGHDRGGRVLHRMALDHAERISKAAVLDIAPTLTMFEATDQTFATGYYHWFFLIQPDGLPEHLIGLDPAYYLLEKLKRWSGEGFVFDSKAVNHYLADFNNEETIHASCEDYRAAATIDLEHDRSDSDRKILCPLLVLWGSKGFIHRNFDVLASWREKADTVEGFTLNCGHFLAEEAPSDLCEAFLDFFN